MYRKCFSTNKCRCIKFNLGDIKEDNKGDKYFRVKGWYLNFNGKNFGKAATVVGILTF